MPIEQLYERLIAAASLDGDDGAIRIIGTYDPAAGQGTKISPPTYPKSPNSDSPYVVEDRGAPDGTSYKCALLDSRQSQANRCEEALQEAIDTGEISLPHLVLDVETHGTAVRITSLSAPHRSRDAYFRDALGHDGARFDATPAGVALLAGAGPAFYRYSPADLVFGVWDSHRQRRIQTKFPRVYTSELVGEGALPGVRMAGRYDMLTGATSVKNGDLDWEIVEKGGGRISEIGLGPIPPGRTPGGVTVRAIRREAALSFAGLAKLRVAEGEAGRTGRAALAALALLGDRLAFGHAGLFLRSGCDLVLTSERLSWVGRGGDEAFDLAPDVATELLRLAVARAAAAGLTWEPNPIHLKPMSKLQAVIDRVFLTSPGEEE
jgi:CRISPR-associated protein Csb1